MLRHILYLSFPTPTNKIPPFVRVTFVPKSLLFFSLLPSSAQVACIVILIHVPFSSSTSSLTCWYWFLQPGV